VTVSFATTLWLTGLSGAGKTTLGCALCAATGAFLIDGNELRRGLCSNLGFSFEDRRENLRRAAAVARLLNDQGADAVVALISPLAADRATRWGCIEGRGLG
jgi:adenylylsulfate kinase